MALSEKENTNNRFTPTENRRLYLTLIGVLLFHLVTVHGLKYNQSQYDHKEQIKSN